MARRKPGRGSRAPCSTDLPRAAPRLRIPPTCNPSWPPPVRRRRGERRGGQEARFRQPPPDLPIPAWIDCLAFYPESSSHFPADQRYEIKGNISHTTWAGQVKKEPLPG